MRNFIICFHHTQWEVFFQIKFHPGMKFYSFHPGMKFTCKQKFFHPGMRFRLAGPATPGRPGGHGLPPLFFVVKRKSGEKGKKERVSKQKLLKGCHQGQNVDVSAIQKFFLSANHGGRHYFSVFHGPSTLKSILQALSRLHVNALLFIKGAWLLLICLDLINQCLKNK